MNGNGFQRLTILEFYRKVMQLNPNGSSCELAKRRLKEWLPRGELKNNTVERPKTSSKKFLHHKVQRETDKKKAIW